MAEFKRSDKALKKDQNGARDVRREIGEEIRSSGTKPRHKHPNRHRADRTRCSNERRVTHLST